MYSCMMGEPSSSSNQMTLASETYLPPTYSNLRRSFKKLGSHASSIEEIIDKSKSHWSQVGEFDFDNEVAEVSNIEVFKTLQKLPTSGIFFKTFGKSEDDVGELVMGEKFAEGGQAELYEVQIKWNSPQWCEEDQKHEIEYVLKVFKKGTFLRHLQSQWPQGMFGIHQNIVNRFKLGLHVGFRSYSKVVCGTLLEDGRFVFVLAKEKEDLRNMIDRHMLTRANNEGPLSKREALEAMYEVAYGMYELHRNNILHRDIKASNVLVSKARVCYIADYECSIGVVGTGFWRAPEILEACKDGTVSTKVELFTQAVDTYSYGMTCYEILTGKLPFEGHLWNDYDLVLQGQRPKLPKYIDGWIRNLLSRCWQSNPTARPSFQEILKIFRANSTICREVDLYFQKQELEVGIRSTLDRSSKFIDMWRSLKLKMLNLKMFRLLRR